MEVGGPVVGEEVLIEAMLLARTDHLIHGISNVTFVVLCMNKDLSHEDVYAVFAARLERELRLRRWLPAWAGGIDPFWELFFKGLS